MKSIFLSCLLLFAGGCLFYQAMYSHSCKVYNFSDSTIHIVKSTEINEEGVRLRGVFHPGQFVPVSVFHTLPFRGMRVTWRREGEEETVTQGVRFRLPKEFTPYDGAAVILFFDDDRFRVAYECYYGEPPEDARDSFDKRTRRPTRCILEDGTPFDPAKYRAYKKENPQGTLTSFLEPEAAAAPAGAPQK